MSRSWAFLTFLLVCQCTSLATVRWISSGTPISSTNKTDHHEIAEIVLTVALNTITLTPTFSFRNVFYYMDIFVYFQGRRNRGQGGHCTPLCHHFGFLTKIWIYRMKGKHFQFTKKRYKICLEAYRLWKLPPHPHFSYQS